MEEKSYQQYKGKESRVQGRHEQGLHAKLCPRRADIMVMPGAQRAPHAHDPQKAVLGEEEVSGRMW